MAPSMIRRASIDTGSREGDEKRARLLLGDLCFQIAHAGQRLKESTLEFALPGESQSNSVLELLKSKIKESDWRSQHIFLF